jgi:hypothetical protein
VIVVNPIEGITTVADSTGRPSSSITRPEIDPVSWAETEGTQSTSKTVSVRFSFETGRQQLQKDIINPSFQLEFPHALERLRGDLHDVSRKMAALDATMRISRGFDEDPVPASSTAGNRYPHGQFSMVTRQLDR